MFRHLPGDSFAKVFKSPQLTGWWLSRARGGASWRLPWARAVAAMTDDSPSPSKGAVLSHRELLQSTWRVIVSIDKVRGVSTSIRTSLWHPRTLS